MKTILKSLAASVSMYSVLPMPRVEWDRGTLRYLLCWLPVVGAVVGGVQWLWALTALEAGAAPGMAAAVAVLLPVGVTGGVHMDGLTDTWDAIGSHQTRERKLEILSDPHTGAFGVIGVAAYLLLGYGLWQQVFHTPGLLAIAVAGPVAARALGALAMVFLPPAKPDGLGATFSGGASRPAAAVICGLAFVLAALAALSASPLWGTVAAAGSLLVLLAVRRACLRGFGGMTGDLTGWLIELLELFAVAVAAVGGLMQ